MEKLKRKHVKALFLFALVIMLVTCNYSSCNDSCVELPDLSFISAGIEDPFIAAGVSFVIQNVVKNLEDNCEDVSVAGETNKSTRAFYRETDVDVFEEAIFEDPDTGQTTYNIVVKTKELLEGESDIAEETYNMETPGQYIFDLEANYDRNVEEKTYDNNNADTETGEISSGSGKGRTSLIITVLGDPESKDLKRKAGEPVVIRFLGSKRINR